MEDSVTFIYKEYRIEFSGDGVSICGEAFCPGERMSIGKIMGHTYNSKDRIDKSHRKDNSLHLDLLIVSEPHNRKGVGTTLMNMFMHYAEKRKVKHVTTSPTPIDGRSMADLEKFYRKFHFSTGIMVKRIEFVNDDIFLMEQKEIEAGDFEAEKIKNINHEVEKAVSAQSSNSFEGDSDDGIEPVDKVELEENIEAAFRMLDEEAQRIEARKAMLEEISSINGLSNKKSSAGKIEDEEELTTYEPSIYGSDHEGGSHIIKQTKNKETDEEKVTLNEIGERENAQSNYIENSKNIGILTTIYYVEERLPKFSKILGISSEFAAQKAYFEQKGHEVISVDSIDLSGYADDSFNVVLAIEAMDGLSTKEEQVNFLKEAYRVCKPYGRIFVSFTSNDMMLANEILNYDPDFLTADNVDKKTMKIRHGSRNTFKISEMEDIIESSGMQYTKKFAMDGIAALMKDQINAMNDRQFNKWMSYHLYACEKEHIIGYSTSIIFVIKKV